MDEFVLEVGDTLASYGKDIAKIEAILNAVIQEVHDRADFLHDTAQAARCAALHDGLDELVPRSANKLDITCEVVHTCLCHLFS